MNTRMSVSEKAAVTEDSLDKVTSVPIVEAHTAVLAEPHDDPTVPKR